MNKEQLAILNSLVTYAAEHVPGGLSDEEREVAQIVGRWALPGNVGKTHNYIQINPTLYGVNIEEVCNLFADMGWRTVAVISDTRPGYTHALILERPVGITHPGDPAR